MISLRLKPSQHKTERYLERLKKRDYFQVLDGCARKGVEALKAATPFRTGLTASSWSYEIAADGKGTTIYWTNSNVTRDGEPIAIMLQYGHGTGTGGYVVGRDYINPAIQPVFDNIAEEVWKAMISL